MTPKAKSNSTVTTAWDAETNVLTHTVLGVGVIRTDLNKVSDAIRRRLTAHGATQRVTDAAAIPAEPLADTEEGRAEQKARRAKAKFEAMQRVSAHLESGSEEWSPAREGGVIGLDGILLRAVCEVTGKDEATIRAMIEANVGKHNASAEPKDKITPRAYLAKLGTGEKVAAVADRMRAALTPAVDPDAELAAMMGE
jgi:hypothetical protein